MAPATAAAVESGAWYELDSHCIFCKEDDYTCGYGPRSMLLCSCCPKGTHVECYEKAKGVVLTQDFIDSGSSWFCSKACEEITAHFEGLPGKRLPIKGESAEYSLEVVKYDKGSKTVKNVVEAAKNIFKSAFDPLVMDNGQDLVTMCCHAYESPDGADEEEEELVDYSAFRVVALRKGSQIVAVATLRVFGDQLAEMPFVATRTGFRRAGHCRRLIKGVEALLRQLCVRWLVLPSIRTVLPMWRYSFSFIPLTLEEQAALEPHIVSPDYESAQLVKKAMWPPPRATGGRRTAGAAAAGGSKGTARRGSTRGRGRNSSSRPTRGNSRRSATRASSGAADRIDDSDSDAANAAREQGPGLFRFKGRNTRAAAAVAAAAGSGDSSSSSSSEDEGDAADFAAGGSQEDEEAAAAWAMWEAAGGKMGSQDKDSDFDAESSSSSDDSDSDSDVDLVSEGEDGVKKGADKTAKAAQKAKQQKQDGQDAGGAEGGKGSEMEAAKAAALEVLRKEVSKAGGVLPEGWNVRLGNRQPTGYYRDKTYTEPGSGKTFKSVPAVKRHLGLAAPLRTGSRRGGSPDPDDPAAAAAGGPAAREGWRRSSTPDQTGAFGSYRSLDPAQQLAQVKLLRARAVAGQQMRLRVMRARRELVAQARLAAILAESLRTFYDTTKDALASTPADGQPSWLQLQAQSAVAQQRSTRHAQAQQQQQQQLVDPKANHSAADKRAPTTLAPQHIGSVQQQQRGHDELTLLRSQLAERDAELSQLKKQQGQLLIQATLQQQLLQQSKTQIAQLQAQLLDAQTRLVQQTPGVLAGAFAAAGGAAVTAATVSAAAEAAARAARRCSTPTLAAAAAEGKTVGLQACAGRQQQGQPADADADDMMASDPYLEVDAQMCLDDPMPDVGEGMGGEPAGQEGPATAEAGATAAAEAATAAEQADDVTSDGPVPHVGRDATDLAGPAPQPESLGDPVSVAAVANSALPAAAVPAALEDPAGAATAATAAAKTAETAAAAASEQADEAAFAAAADDDDAGDTAALRAAAVAALTAYTPTKAAAAAATRCRSPAAACSTRAATNSSSKVHKAAAGSNAAASAADAGGSDVEPAAAQLLPSSTPAAAAPAPAAAVAATLPDLSPVNAEQHTASPHTADPTGTHNSALALNQTSPPAAATTTVAPPAAATAVAAGVHHACPNTPAQSPAPSAAAAASGVAPAADTASGPAAVGSAVSAAELLEVLAVLTAPQKGSTPAGASDTTVAPDILTTGGKPALLAPAPLASESQQQQLAAQPAGRAAPPAAPSAPVRTSPDCAGSVPAAAGVPAATNTGATGLLTDPAAVSASLGNHSATSSVGAADAASATAPAAEPTVVAVPAAGTSEVSEAAAAGGGSAAAPAPAAFGDGAERLNSNSKASPARPDASTMPAAADTAAAACATPAAASLSTNRLLHSSRASPKVSDSFLSGLLPYVVGQLMTTPQSAATTAKTPAAAAAAAVTGATAEPAQRRLSLSLAAVSCALGQVAVHTPESAAGEGAAAAVGMQDSLTAAVARGTQPAAAGAVAVDSPTVVAGRAAAAADTVVVETSSAQTGSCSPPSPPSISLTATAASKLTQGSVSAAAAAAAAAAAGPRVSSSMPSTGVADPAAASGTSKRPRSAWVSSTEYKQQARTLAASSLSQGTAAAATAAGMCHADAVPVFSPTPSRNKSAAAPVATPSDPHHQQQQQHNTAEEGKENLQVPAARPAKKCKVQSAVLAWFGDIADMDENSNERGPDEAECTVSTSDLGPGSGGTAVDGDLDSGPGSGGSGGSGGSDGSGGSSGIRDPGSDAALLRALEGDRRFGSAGKGAGGAAAAAAAGRTPAAAAAAVTIARGGSGGCGGRGMQQPGSMLAAAAAAGPGGGRAGARPQGVSAQKQGVLGQVQQGSGSTGTAAAGAAAGGGGRSSDGGTWRGRVLGGGSRKGSGGLEAQLAAAADAAGVEACDVDMDAEICAAMDTAALFAYAGDV